MEQSFDEDVRDELLLRTSLRPVTPAEDGFGV